MLSSVYHWAPFLPANTQRQGQVVVNNVEPVRKSSVESILGKGYASWCVTAFNLW